MLLAAAFVFPCLCGQIFTPKTPLLRCGWGPKVLVIASVAAQLLANQQPALSWLLVPAAFTGGTLAVILVIWASGRRLLPTLLAGVGAIANLVPIVWYGSMPVSRTSRASFADTQLNEPSFISAKHTEMELPLTWRNPISLLTDAIPMPIINGVISIGDILLVAAFIALGATLARSHTTHPTPYAANNATDGTRATMARCAA